MEQPHNREGRRPSDPISHEMHEMFTGHQVDALQGALYIQRACETILQHVDTGELNLAMPLGEALEKLTALHHEFIGEDDDEAEDNGE